MDRWYRFVMSGMAAILLVPLYIQGRAVDPTMKGDGTALFHTGAASVLIRFMGDIPHPGIYEFPMGTTIASAIKLTHLETREHLSNSDALISSLKDGVIIVVSNDVSQHHGFTIQTMGARERLLLGIRLDSNLMGVDDWEVLPGIGKTLARRIIEYRQKNGDFESIDAVELVPGIGVKSINRFKDYF